MAQTSPCDSPRFIAAVRSTAGEVLLDDRGQIADSYFGASCGGVTANIRTLWGGKPQTYLRGVHDDYCAAMPHHSWTDVMSHSQLIVALRSDPRTDIGSRLDDIVVTRRDETGRAEMVTLEGEKRKVVRGWDFKIIVGRALGWSKLKSSRFAIARAGNDFVFRGSGFGHGLGLCQEGAHVMAQRGVNYRQILAKYFPGTTVVKGDRSHISLGEKERLDLNAENAKVSAEVAEKHLCVPLRNPLRPLRLNSTSAHHHPRRWHADLLLSREKNPRPAAVSMRKANTRLNLSSENFRVSYPSQVDRRDAELVLRTLEATRADLIRRISAASITLASPPTVDVHINETTGDFVGRTGQPWWAAGATRGARIELQPVAVLKSRGVLITTLRHELAHAFIDATSHGRAPRWLAEGFALHLAGEGKMISRYQQKGGSSPGRSPTVREGSVATVELESKLSSSLSADEMRTLYAAAYREVSRIIQSEGEAKVWRRIASY